MVKTILGAQSWWVLRPSLSQDEAAATFGADIPDEPWSLICEAFARHGQRLADLAAPRHNKNKNDTRSWYSRINGATDALDKAIVALGGIDDEILLYATEVYVRTTSRNDVNFACIQRLRNAHDELMRVDYILRVAQDAVNAEPDTFSFQIVTESESRKILAGEIFRALEPFGARLSNGWTVSNSEPSNADLTGFERLIEGLAVHQGETPAATAKWLREALVQKR